MRLLLLLVAGCAPVYAPSAAHVSMLDGTGDTNLGLRAGTWGWQLDGSYALSDAFAVHGTAQTMTLAHQGSSEYTLLSGGLGWYGAWGPPKGATEARDPTGPRLGATLDVGVAPGEGNYQSLHYSGVGVRASLQLDAGYETPWATGGLAIRPVYLHFVHDEDSEDFGETADWVLTDVLAVVRGGSEHVKLEAQAGFWIPLRGRGNIGVPFPMIFGVGVVGDLPGPVREEAPAFD